MNNYKKQQQATNIYKQDTNSYKNTKQNIKQLQNTTQKYKTLQNLMINIQSTPNKLQRPTKHHNIVICLRYRKLRKQLQLCTLHLLSQISFQYVLSEHTWANYKL